MRWIVLVLFALAAGVVAADRGGIPFRPEVKVFEPGQKALIAFNGEEEVLYLSTDLRASAKTKVVELVPFPSKPKVSEADEGVLQRVQRWLWPHYVKWWGAKRAVEDGAHFGRGNGVVVLEHKRIGAHNISILKATEADELIAWIEKKVGKEVYAKARYRQRLETVAKHYIACSFHYFAFDEVDLEAETRSVEPLEYRFKTPFPYYPLVISSLMEGETTITLGIFVPDLAPFIKTMPKGFEDVLEKANGKAGASSLTLMAVQLEALWKSGASLFERSASVEFCVYRYKGKVKFENDIPELDGARKRGKKMAETLIAMGRQALEAGDEELAATILADVSRFEWCAEEAMKKASGMLEGVKAKPTAAPESTVCAYWRALGYAVCGMNEAAVKSMRGVSARKMPEVWMKKITTLITKLKEL